MSGIVREKRERRKVFYAIKMKNGKFMTRRTSTTPALFTTKGRAKGVANSINVRLDPNSYDIVRFAEI